MGKKRLFFSFWGPWGNNVCGERGKTMKQREEDFFFGLGLAEGLRVILPRRTRCLRVKNSNAELLLGNFLEREGKGG